MATVTKPIALDESFNTTEVTPRNIADVLAEGLSHITGRTASEVEYDNTDSGLAADNVQDALDEIAESVPTLPSVDIQTAVDEFETYNGGLLSECKVALSPNQDLHGYENPWVGGAGKNKAEQTVAKIKSLNTSGTWSGNAYTWNGITYTILTDDANNVIGYDVDGTATARGWLFISDTDLGNVDAHYNGSSVQGYIRTSDNPAFVDNVYMCFYNAGSKKSYILVDVGLTKSHDKWYPMARLSSVVDPTFEPYSNVCPISGHTQVEVENHQKNLCDDSLIVQGDIDNSTGADTADGSLKHIRSGYCNAESSTQYTVSHNHTIGSGTLKVFEYRSDKSFIRRTNAGAVTSLSYTFTTHSECKYIRIAIYDENGISKNNTWVQLELGSTATAYEPYNGYQVTVALGDTYYSGTLDVVSGMFTPDTASVDLGSLTWTKDSSKTFYAFITDSLTGLQDMWCEVLDPYPENYRLNEYNNYPDNIIARNTTQKNVYVKCTTYEDGTASDFRTAMSGYKLVYELATPTSIQLSPTMVKALVGENHLSAPLEGQEITESKYKQMFTFDDVIAYIQSLS